MAAHMNAQPDPRLHGFWLTLARVAWVALAAFYIGAYLVTVPIRLTETPQFVSPQSEITATQFLTGLAQLGISPEGYTRFQQLSSVFIVLPYLGLGVFIFWRKSKDWMAILTSLLFISFLGPFDTLARLNANWTVVGDASALLTSIVSFLWFFIFPDGRFVPRWTRWIFFLLLATQVWRVFQPDLYQRSFAYLAPIIFGGILIAQVYRYRHAGAVQRQQIKWVVYGIVMGTAPLLLFFLIYFAVLISQPPLTREIAVNFFGDLLWSFFLIIFPISLTLAILRSRLLDIDVIIRRTLQYSVLSGLLALTYFGLVIVLQSTFTAITGQRQNEFVTVLSTLALAALFAPLRRRVQDVIDRRFYRKKYDAAKTLAAFAATCRDETDLDKLTASLISVVQETMQPESVSLWLKKTEPLKHREH